METAQILCFAYVQLPTIPMERILWNGEYIMYNQDHALDNYIYYAGLFGCA